MKHESQPCDLESLRRLLGEEVTETRRADLLAHLDDCEHCRVALEGLAAEGNWWDDARRFVGRDRKTESRPAAGFGERSPVQPARFPSDSDPSLGDDADLRFLTPSDAPGSLGRFGPYEIREVLGKGGMGIVLRAHDSKLDRQVAIKVLAPGLHAGVLARRRFEREARAAAAVVHEHVVAIHAVDECEGLPYLVMQYIAGRSLQTRIDNDGPLRTEEILRIGMQAALGLAAAHAQGLVHRDVKPANILLENGVERVKLTDFGLARAIDDSSLTHSGVVAGTPQYMAPEQARAEPFDHRADLFSLGSVLYAMCAGRPPFRADSTPAVLRQISDEDPRPVRQENPEVPEWLAAVIERLHAKGPADRYQSASEVAEILGRCLARLQEPGRAAEHVRPPWRALVRPPIGSRRNSFIFLTLLGLAGAGAILGLTYLARTSAPVVRDSNPGPSPVVTETTPELAPTELTSAPGPVRSISGVVRDRVTGKALQNVRLTLPGTSAAATTDADGRYVLRGPANSRELGGPPPAFDLLVEPGAQPYFAANVRVESGESPDPVHSDINLSTGIPFKIRLTDEAHASPVKNARIVYRPIHPNSQVNEALPSAGSHLHCVGAEWPDGIYTGVMLPGPGAICVENFVDYYGPISIDPVAFFVPGTTASSTVHGSTVYGTTQLLAVDVGGGRGIHLLPQDGMSGILLVNPRTGDSLSEMRLSLHDNRLKKAPP